MRRPSKTASPKLSADSQRLVAFAQAIVQASSRLEERAWERSLDTLLNKLLKNDHQASIDAALEHLFKTELNAYDVLMESTEAVSESCVIEHEGASYEALLVALPILAWTRFAIASGPIAPDLLMTLAAHLSAHVLAADIRLALAPTLMAIDQLPRSHAETFAVTQRMAQAALKGTALRAAANPPETAPFLADTRYLLAAVVVPAGAPLFRWQAAASPLNVLAERETALRQWRAQATPNITRLLPGCGIELLLPEAYYIACREADKQIRPASIRAAVHYLTHTLAVEAKELHAVIGAFCEPVADAPIEEYRIGFTLRKQPEVIYGVVWPLFGPEESEEELRAAAAQGLLPAGIELERKTPLEDIMGLLREAGITHIKHHAERFPIEFCDDCGAPLFADADGELMHPEMPEDAPPGTSHFH